MAFSCGFYNSLNGDRKYNTRQISEIFDGIIRDGVYMNIGEKLTVKEGTGMQISVGTGRAWFNHSWSLVDSELPLTVEQSDLVLDRIDAVVLEVNESNETRDNVIKVVKGTAASSPSKPEMTNTEFVHQYPLAYITVKKGVTSITTSDIEINVGKDNCPYVTSVLEAVSIEELYAQWESQFSDWEEGQKTQFEAWFAMIKGQLSEDAAGNLQVQIDDKGIQVYTHSKSGSVHEFTGSGPNGRALLTDDIEEGDTFTVNGSPVTAYMGTEDAVDSMAGNAWNGKWVTFVYDGDAINFKGGGGLSTADRAKLIPENIRNDVKIFEGTSREVTGNLFPSDQNNCLAASWNKVYDVNNAPMMANNIMEDSPISVTANTITVKRDFKAYVYKKGWCWPSNVTRFTGTSNIPTGQQSFTAGESFYIILPCEHGYNQTSGILIIFAVNG